MMSVTCKELNAPSKCRVLFNPMVTFEFLLLNNVIASVAVLCAVKLCRIFKNERRE